MSFNRNSPRNNPNNTLKDRNLRVNLRIQAIAYSKSVYAYKARLLSDLRMNCLRTEDTLWKGALFGKVNAT